MNGLIKRLALGLLPTIALLGLANRLLSQSASSPAGINYQTPSTLHLVVPAHNGPFKHSGLLHTSEDFARIKADLAKGLEPCKSGFDKLKAHPESQADWRIRGPFETVSRGPNGQDKYKTELEMDGNAAYQNALMWAITGDDAHAKKAVEIINAWSGTLKNLIGSDVALGTGIYGFKYVNAAEILRDYQGWDPRDFARCKTMFKDVFLPRISNFAVFANGNWDGACIKTVMAIGVFCDDREIFDSGLDYYYNGKGNGSILHYVINEAGECQESGRDQTHTQLGLAFLAEACEIGWNQGIDMYGAADNRLLKGFEYTARYNLGEDVPFTPYIDTTGRYKWSVISMQARGQFRPIFEMVYNHYHNRKRLDTPYVARVVERIRPEGAAFQADHPGFGTIMFARSPGEIVKPAN